MSALIQQGVYVPETDTYYASTHRHHYVSIRLPGGATVAIDGGLCYIRRAASDWTLFGTRVVDLTLYDTTPFPAICRRLLWGSRGKDGNQSLTFKPIAMLTTPHLRAILRTQWQIEGSMAERVVRHVLETRRAAR